MKRVTKQYDPETNQIALLFQILYPKISKNSQPRHRIISAYTQKIEAPNNNYQYILFAAEPYETIAFKIPNKPLENDMEKYGDKIFVDWDRNRKLFSVQIQFKNPEENVEVDHNQYVMEDEDFSNPLAK